MNIKKICSENKPKSQCHKLGPFKLLLMRRTSAESLAVDQSPSKYTEVRPESSGLKQNQQVQRTLPDSTGLHRTSIGVHRTQKEFSGLNLNISDFLIFSRTFEIQNGKKQSESGRSPIGLAKNY